jgi:hypothetical protein
MDLLPHRTFQSAIFFGNQENTEINIREYVRPRQNAKICIREYKLGYSMPQICYHLYFSKTIYFWYLKHICHSDDLCFTAFALFAIDIIKVYMYFV